MHNRIVIFRLPFRGPTDEFLPLRGNPALDVSWVHPQDYDGSARVIILPGSGRTIDDLAYLRESGGAEAIRAHLAAGNIVLGVCGGMQILGKMLYDPLHQQGDIDAVEGLGYLPHSTIFGPEMMSCSTRAILLEGTGLGGEITAGEERRSGFSWVDDASATTEIEPAVLPLLRIKNRTFHKPEPQPEKVGAVLWNPGAEAEDGWVSRDRQVYGTYVHLICHNEAFLRTLLSRL